MTRPADRLEHALTCRCQRCARLARLRRARFAVALSVFGFVITSLTIVAAIRSIL